MKITIFTLNDCSHCVSLKKRLREENIDFEEIDINENEQIWENLVEDLKYEILPTILIHNEETDSVNALIPEVNFKDEEDLMIILKSYIKNKVF